MTADHDAVDGRHHPARALLAIAAIAVGLAAADTYVVVLALPEMMAGVGLGIDALARATPIVSGFLLGYVAVLPLVGRLADVIDRHRVLLGCLAVFVVGSAVTALAVELPVLVGGRILQGIGGGGLVPATLALVADLWPPHRRGLPFGVVGAVQEAGSVLGPVLGAAVLALGTWRDIFWLNALAGIVLAGALTVVARRTAPSERTARVRQTAPSRPSASPRTAPARSSLAGRRTRLVLAGPVPLALAGLTLLLLALVAPDALVTDVDLGVPFIPLVTTLGITRLATPMGLLALVLLLAAALTSRSRWRPVFAQVDVLGAALAAVTLGSLVLTFASADPEREVVGPWATVLVPVGLTAALGYLLRHRRTAIPLVPRGVVTGRVIPGLLVSLATGVVLVAVVVDVPVLARLTLTHDQADAALVLVRFLVAVPVGALFGGWALRRFTPGLVAAPALVVTAVGLVHMHGWGRDTLATAPVTVTVVLVLVGLGVGAAIAPVNVAVLDHVPAADHGVASALVVVARMVGMVVGIALLTALGLRQYYDTVAALPDPTNGPALLGAAVVQVQTVFAGAAWCAAAGAVVALLIGVRPRRTSH